MADQPYIDPLIGKLIARFNLEGPPDLRNKYFFVAESEIDDVEIPRSQFPCALVYFQQDGGGIGSAGLQEDEHVLRLAIRVMVDRNINKGRGVNQLHAQSTLTRYLWERDKDGKLKAPCLAFVLRKYQQVADNLWAGLKENVRMRYVPTSQERGRGLMTQEAELLTDLVNHQLKPQ
jgi:hypothetical protein